MKPLCIYCCCVIINEKKSFNGLVYIKEIQVIKYATAPYNLGEDLDLATSIFNAPKDGIYKFTVRSYAFGDRTCVGVAIKGSALLVKTALWVNARSPGVASTILQLEAGEEVVPIIYVETDPIPSSSAYRGPVFNEFSGELVAELCGGKAC
jgi:hypothetical protein